jgi:iron complex outermembrane receptor protein
MNSVCSRTARPSGRHAAGVLPGLLLLAAAPMAAGQVLEEIVVTAQKREQSIQDVSIDITAFSGEQIDRLGLESSSEIARLTPGVSIAATSAGQDAQFTIRGVTQTDFTDFVEPPNAVYVDEGYIATTQGQRFGLFDIERVEVLKGPQGTLFGRNATGGLAHYITRKPTREFEAFGEALYGSYNQVRIDGAVSGPLTDKLAGRLSGMYNRHDEIADNHYPAGNPVNPLTGVPFAGSPSGAEDHWNDNQWALRGQLLWELDDRTKLLVSGFVAHEEVSVGYYQQGALTAVIDANGNHVNSIRAASDPNRCEAISAETGACLPIDFVDGDFGDTQRPVVGGDLFGYREFGGTDDLDVSVDHALDDGNEYDVVGFTGNLSWELEPFTITAISHLVNYEKRQTLDTDVSPVPQSLVINKNDTGTFSQEIRFDGEGGAYRWVAGFYYLLIDNDNVIGLGFSPDSPITLLTFGFPFETSSVVNLETNSYSAFGQFEFDLNENWTFIAGLRTVFENKDFQYDNFLFPSPNDELVDDDQPPLNTGVFEYPSFSGDTSETLWAGKLAVQYSPDDDWMLWGAINRGVKAGSFNGKLNDFTPPLPNEDIPYDEEILLAYELGFKSTLFDGRTSLNGTFYYYDYNDYQAFVFSGSSGFVRNADAEYHGAELQLISRPTDNLDLMLGLAWIDAEISDLEIANNVFRNVQPAHTPEWQLSGIGRYVWPEAISGGDVSVQLDFSYTDDRFHNIRNFDAQRMDDYWLANARVSWLSGDDRWEATAFVNNITDERYIITGFDLATLCGCAEEAWGKPRWFGASLHYNWR